MSSQGPASADAESAEVRSAMCWASPGCHDRCAILVSVKDGRIIGIRGNRKSANGERLFQSCPDRLPHLARWLYHPDQLMYPLKRAGDRGENKWERLSWDQALHEVAERLKNLKAQYGAETLATTEGTMRSDIYAMRTRFLNLFGNPGNIGCAGTVCACNKQALRRAILGTTTLRDNLNVARCVVFWGWNIIESRRRRWLSTWLSDSPGCTTM